MKIELHSHTAHSSRCGQVDAAQSVRMHAEAGYGAMVITDHFNNENLEYFPGTPIEQVRAWLGGYEEAKAAGEREGIRVLFGLEARLQDCDNDYLILGAEPNFVLENPRLHYLSLPELHRLCGEYGALLIQAHPNRKVCHLAPAEDLDGVEVANGNPRHDSRNDLTLAQAEEHPEWIRTSGSDFHRPEDVDHGGIETEMDIHTSAELAECLRCGRYKLL